MLSTEVQIQRTQENAAQPKLWKIDYLDEEAFEEKTNIQKTSLHNPDQSLQGWDKTRQI